MTRERTSYMARRDGEEPAADDPLLDFAPVPHKQLKRNSIGPARQRKFVAALAATGIVTDAAREIGASPEALYHLRVRPGAEEFRAAWDAALDRAIARLEGSALARAIDGEERMVVSAGKVLGTERRFSDPLAMFFLRQRRPERFGAVPAQDLKPGHPLYEKIKQEVLDEYEGDEQEVLESIDKFIDDMRVRRAANEQILAEFDAQDAAAKGADEKGAEHEERADGALRPARPSIRRLG
jgi:hypothetical protein